MADARELAIRYGMCNNAGFLAHYLTESSVVKSLILMSLRDVPFTGPFTNPNLAYLSRLFAIARCSYHQITSQASRISVGIGEALSVHISRDRIIDQDAARREFCSVMRVAFAEGIFNDTSVITPRTYQDHHPTLVNVFGEQRVPREFPAVDPENYSYDQCLILFYLTCLTSNENVVQITISMIVSCYCALSKRGSATDGFINKIRESVNQELHLNIDLRADVLRFVYSAFMKGVTSENAEHAFRYLSGLIPEMALRLRLTLEQAIGSGLTTLNLISQAFEKYPDFYWNQANTLTNGQLHAWARACRIVGQNQYFGFNRDLGNAKSTKYKSIGYVARQLLVKLPGDLPLRHYQGFVGTIPAKAQLDALIQPYVDTIKTRCNAEIEEPGIDEEFRDLINREREVERE